MQQVQQSVSVSKLGKTLWKVWLFKNLRRWRWKNTTNTIRMASIAKLLKFKRATSKLKILESFELRTLVWKTSKESLQKDQRRRGHRDQTKSNQVWWIYYLVGIAFDPSHNQYNSKKGQASSRHSKFHMNSRRDLCQCFRLFYRDFTESTEFTYSLTGYNRCHSCYCRNFDCYRLIHNGLLFSHFFWRYFIAHFVLRTKGYSKAI